MAVAAAEELSGDVTCDILTYDLSAVNKKFCTHVLVLKCSVVHVHALSPFHLSFSPGSLSKCPFILVSTVMESKCF